MRLLKQAMAVSGTVTMIAVLVAVFAPKTAHAVAAALVQIEPGTTTQVGQNESQLVSLICPGSFSYCLTNSPEGASGSAYMVPSGYTLIVTDYQFINSGFSAGAYGDDILQNSSTGGTLAVGLALADADGVSDGHEHYATGIRVGSEVTIEDRVAS